MRIALYIEDGREQIVLTPETKIEKAILARLTDDTSIVSIKRGSFYDCMGGWTRHRPSYSYDTMFGTKESSDDSTMLVITGAKPKESDADAQPGTNGPEEPEHV